MRYIHFLIPILLLAACSTGTGPIDEDRNATEDTNGSEKTTPVQKDPVLLDRFEQRMADVDSYIMALEDSGGFSVNYIKKGSASQFLELFAFLLEGDIAKVEAYYYAGKQNTSERFYFKDKRLLRYEVYEENRAGQSAEMLAREEMHYFDAREELVRSAFREASGNEAGGLQKKDMEPLVEFDRDLKQHVITEKMLKYTSELGQGKEIDPNTETFTWPFRALDIDKIRTEILEAKEKNTEGL